MEKIGVTVAGANTSFLLTWFYLQDREKTSTEKWETKKQSGLKTESCFNTVISYQGILPIKGLWENKQEDNV